MKNNRILFYFILCFSLHINATDLKNNSYFILKFKECEISIPNKFVLLSSFNTKQYELIYNPSLLDLNSTYEAVKIRKKTNCQDILNNEQLKLNGVKIIENKKIDKIHKIRAKGIVKEMGNIHIDINFLIGDEIVVETFNVNKNDVDNILNHCLATKK
jgi:hypothetical protein